jgi:hypothetical protein
MAMRMAALSNVVVSPLGYAGGTQVGPINVRLSHNRAVHGECGCEVTLGKVMSRKDILIIFGITLYLLVAGAFLLFFYGLVVIVFRDTFGVELPRTYLKIVSRSRSAINVG